MDLFPFHPFQKHSSSRSHLPPGTLIPDEIGITPTIEAISYGKDTFEKTTITSEEVGKWRGQNPVLWLSIIGLGDTEVYHRLQTEFDLHPLALEDTLDANQSAKVEDYDDYLFIVLRIPKTLHRYVSEQVSLFLFHDMVISVQQGPKDHLLPVLRRIEGNRGRIRQLGADYLCYALIDVLVDLYFPYLDSFANDLDNLEEKILDSRDHLTPDLIHSAKRDMLALRRVLRPLRDALKTLSHEEVEFISPEVILFLRDCYDHAVQALDLTETYREFVSGLMDLHLAFVSTKMNEVMKVLTLIATLFIPLTFIVGIYGMNFNTSVSAWSMPELNWKWGYPAIMLLMVLIITFQLLYFRYKRWLGGGTKPSHLAISRIRKKKVE